MQRTMWPDTDVLGYMNDHHTQLFSALRTCAGPASLLWLRTLSSGWTWLQKSIHMSKSPHLAACFPSSQRVEFFLEQRKVTTASNYSSTFYCKITIGLDTDVRNNIEISQVPLIYLAPTVASCKTLVWNKIPLSNVCLDFPNFTYTVLIYL